MEELPYHSYFLTKDGKVVKSDVKVKETKTRLTITHLGTKVSVHKKDVITYPKKSKRGDFAKWRIIGVYPKNHKVFLHLTTYNPDKYKPKDWRRYIWKDIEGFKGYQISDTGIVRTMKDRMWVIIAPHVNDGINTVHLYRNNKRFKKRVRRLVANAFIPNPEGKKLVIPRDGNNLNDNVRNLQWMTAKEFKYKEKYKKKLGGVENEPKV